MTSSDNGFFMTPHEIYERITGGPGARSLGFAQDATLSEWRQESDRAERIRAMAATIHSGWQGDASVAAYGAAMPLADMALQGAHELQNAREFLIQQSESFHRAANDVRPVPAQPPENSLDDQFPFDVDHDKEVTSYQADVQHNIQVFRVGGYPGSRGTGGGGGFGPRGASGRESPGELGAVRGVGLGAGALAAEEAAVRRAGQAGTTGGARPGGAGSMGAPVEAGRGKDDEDTEHQRKVLLESDAEDTFGSDVLTAPQVIGDDEYED